MSLGRSGSTTNTTGICRTSPAASVCWVKQKHSSFLKYRSEEGVGKRDRVDVLGQVRIDHEHHRHLPHLARGQRLLGEAEAFQFPEVLRRLPRSVTGHRLPGDRL